MSTISHVMADHPSPDLHDFWPLNIRKQGFHIKAVLFGDRMYSSIDWESSTYFCSSLLSSDL